MMPKRVCRSVHYGDLFSTENLALKGIASPGYEGKKKSFEDSSVESSKKRKKRKVEAEELDFSWLSEMFANLAK